MRGLTMLLALRRRAARAAVLARNPGARRRVEAAGAEQLDRFHRLAPELAGRYRALPGHASSEAAPPWQGYAAELERALLPRPPADFLSLPVVMATMLPHTRRARRLRLAYLEARLAPAELRGLLVEDAAGGPAVAGPYATSANRVHQLAHLERFAEVTGVDPAGVESVVEWGGGYGELCRVWLLVGRPTYTIVDLPIVSCLQWLFLASVLGEDEVVLHERAGELVAGRVNLVPLGVEVAPAADVFVSTWALSESPPAVQDAVAGGGFFGAAHLLLAYQCRARDFPAAERIEELARARGATIEPVLGHPGSRYAFQ